MFTLRRGLLVGAALPILLLSLTQIGVASNHDKRATQAQASQRLTGLAEKVRHALVMLPRLTVFDDLKFKIEGGNTVVLLGEVWRPILKSDAEGAVRRIEEVAKVVNNIEVLPVSPMDDSIRFATYRAIFSKPGLEKYAVQVVSPIRIIVKNGNVTLDGVVLNQMDKTIADMAARSVPDVFSVTDNLKIG